MGGVPSAAGYSPAQAARVLDVTPQRVRQLADAGVLSCTRTSLGRLIDPGSVQALAAARAEKQRSQERER